jgi:hypothetical protein
MPPRKTNFQGDQFTYAIDVLDADGGVEDHIAGANNLHVANRAFEQLLFYYNERTILMLREGARVMRREPGTGGWHREFIERMSRSPS